MSKTTRCVLFYSLTPTEVVSPTIRELERKEKWIAQMQKFVEADWKPQIIKVTYELFDPAIEKQQRFFNGTCVKYYVIQNLDLVDRTPTSEEMKLYREQLLDEMLGYDMALVNRVVRKRKSTTDFKSVAAWNKFLNTLEETIFAEAGYEFPDSKEFWDLVKRLGYDDAEKFVIKKLQDLIKNRCQK